MKSIFKRKLGLLLIITLLAIVGCGSNKAPKTVKSHTKSQQQSVDSDTTTKTGNQPDTDIIETSVDNADLEPYFEVLDIYYYNLKSQQTYDEFEVDKVFNTMATYAYSKDGYDKAGSLEYTGYGLVDLNCDGVKELIIGNLSDDEKLDKMIYYIGSIANNVPCDVDNSTDKHFLTESYYLCKGNKIGYEIHNGKTDYYGLRELSRERGENSVEEVSFKHDHWEKSSEFYGDETAISDEEGNKAKERYQASRMRVQLSPFSEYTPKNSEDYYDDDYYEDNSQILGKGYSSCQEAYIAYLDSIFYTIDCGSFLLINLDDDNIPELICDTRSGAGGAWILSYYDGKISSVYLPRSEYTYIEKSGLICSCVGHMGAGCDKVYRLEKGKWKLQFDGENAYEYGDGDFEYFYYAIDGKEVSEQTYLSKLNKIYDTKKAKRPPEDYLAHEEVMLQLMSGTGKLFSFASHHKYELFMDDCTWEEAVAKCANKGGHLASIDYEVDNLIRSVGKQNCRFYVGASNVEGDNEGSIYREADGVFYIMDAQNDMVANNPSFKRRTGYICEYGD